jgi:ABC-type Fe3+/spermidine/putrescine transport system ATPase subunit
MEAGKVSQVDSPRGLYEAPATSFVAGFIGDANFLEGRVEEPLSHGRLRVMVAGLGSLIVTGPSTLFVGQAVRVMVRPERLNLSMERPTLAAGENLFPTRIETVTYFGPHTKAQVRCGPHALHVQQPTGKTLLAADTEAWLHFEPEVARVVD